VGGPFIRSTFFFSFGQTKTFTKVIVQPFYRAVRLLRNIDREAAVDVRPVRFIKRVFRTVAPPALFISLTAYFGWNALHGAHGIRAYQEQLKLKDQALQSQQDSKDEQIVWRRRVAALKEQALDADMLDERARAMLNLTRAGDIVIPYGPHDKLF